MKTVIIIAILLGQFLMIKTGLNIQKIKKEGSQAVQIKNER